MKELKDIVLKKGDVVYYNDGQIYLVNSNEIQLDTKTCNTIIKVLRPLEYQIIYKSSPILDKEEKEYLEAVCRPFKDRITTISKRDAVFGDEGEYEYIVITCGKYGSCLPSFKKGTMYKGMEYKEYALKELGLFE